MITKNAPQVASGKMDDQLQDLNEEFKRYLEQLNVNRQYGDQLSTYSPLVGLLDFDFDSLQSVHEVGYEEMLNNDDGIKRLLANVFVHCKPGVLSDEDVSQLSGINGREIGQDF